MSGAEFKVKHENFDQNPYHFDKIDDEIKNLEKRPQNIQGQIITRTPNESEAFQAQRQKFFEENMGKEQWHQYYEEKLQEELEQDSESEVD